MRNRIFFTLFLLLFISFNLFSQTYLEKKEYKRFVKVYKAKNYNNAYKRIRSFIEKYPSSYYLSEALFHLALLEKNYYSTIFVYKKLIKDFPKYEKCDEALYRLGKLYLLHNNLSQGIRSFNKLITDYKKSNYIYGSKYYMGMIYLIKHDYSDSLKYFDKVISYNKKDKFFILASVGKANIYFEKKEHYKSIVMFKELLKLKNRNYYPVIYFGIGNNYNKLKNYDKAYYYLRRVVKEYPGSSEYELAMEKLNYIKNNKTIFNSINWDKFKAKDRPEHIRKGENTYYAVQIASVKNKRYANDWRIKLRTGGFSSFIKKIETKKGVFYRTYVGKYDKKKDAENAKNKIEYAFKLKGKVVKLK